MNFSAALLVGGRSSRMGRDKATLPYQGQWLWQRQAAILLDAGACEILLSGPFAGGNPGPRFLLVPDRVVDCGPLGGLDSCLRRAHGTHLLLLAVDLPHMTAAFLRDLWSACSPGCGAVAATEQDYEPLAAFYPREILPLITARMERGNYALQPLIDEALQEGYLTKVPIQNGELDFFRNWNSPQD